MPEDGNVVFKTKHVTASTASQKLRIPIEKKRASKYSGDGGEEGGWSDNLTSLRFRLGLHSTFGSWARELSYLSVGPSAVQKQMSYVASGFPAVIVTDSEI